MSILEVRRHAERAHAPGDIVLSAPGREMARSLAGTSYKLVVSSPLPRAQVTAEIIGGRLDGTEPALLPDIGAASLFGSLGTLQDWAGLLAERDDVGAFVDEQLAAWSAIAKRVGEKDRILVISHSGIIDLPAVSLAAQLGSPLSGLAFGFCEGVRVTYMSGAPTNVEILRNR